MDEESTKEMQLTRFRFFKYESDSKTCIKKLFLFRHQVILKECFHIFGNILIGFLAESFMRRCHSLYGKYEAKLRLETGENI